MTDQVPLSEYLVLSRGQWHKEAAPADIQTAIDEFYAWLDRMVDAGRMKRGQRLATPGATVSRKGVVTDGPYGEAKEVVGGYWSIFASNLEEAARIAAGNPCLRHGLFYEIRPIETEQASAYVPGNETPRPD